MFRLLAVDSEFNVLQSFKKWLQAGTLEIETAQTGQQGLELIRHFRPDALILDLHLPDTSGLDLLDKLQELDARVPVTVITAHAAAAETAVEAMKRGAVDWLLKPVECPQLRAAVQRALERDRFRHVPVVFRDTIQGEESGSLSAFPHLPSQAWLAGLMDFTQEMLRGGEVDIYRRVCLEMDRIVLGTVLHHVKGNQVKASELLGISRTTLRAKLHGLKLAGDRPQFSGT